MALIAAGGLSGWRNLMGIRQRKTSAGMVKRRIRPRNRVMALRTERGGEARRNVIRHTPAK